MMTRKRTRQNHHNVNKKNSDNHIHNKSENPRQIPNYIELSRPPLARRSEQSTEIQCQATLHAHEAGRTIKKNILIFIARYLNIFSENLVLYLFLCMAISWRVNAYIQRHTGHENTHQNTYRRIVTQTYRKHTQTRGKAYRHTHRAHTHTHAHADTNTQD